ncbi:tRNA (adenosine(37)-N6)-threonylcarbamoyltransferase complex ATPase subunit type 1 TsaE [Limnohabitans sp. DCL3]|uniref:tRNA (adenosine(37)-N6)-threonylcarbamoyltransferase complex ATPase subunit type 1 TsaE n=1 Tax=Limnohabitans sp. DCL3 TaxID=3374103 RepID=UPI003A8BF2E9
MSTLSSHPPIVETPATAVHWEGLWPTEAATQAFAQRLSAALQLWPGGRDACLALHGNLGAGKTTLVRHLLRAAGVQGRIKSPTYAVVEPHQAGTGDAVWPIWHFDFYRFNDPQEWEDAGFRDIFAGPGLKLMEWPQKVAGQLPPPDWVIALDAIDEDQRLVRISAGSQRGRSWLSSWVAQSTEGAPDAP